MSSLTLKRKPAKNAKKTTKKNGKAKAGRPKRIFTNGDRKLLLEMAIAGATDAEMCKELGCGRNTLYRAFVSDQPFRNSIKKGKEIVDDRVERSLYERATGYDVIERHITDSEKDGRKITVIEKRVGPDTAAAFIWLKNRRPKQWRDKQHLEIDNGDNLCGILAKIANGENKAV